MRRNPIEIHLMTLRSGFSIMFMLELVVEKTMNQNDIHPMALL